MGTGIKRVTHYNHIHTNYASISGQNKTSISSSIIYFYTLQWTWWVHRESRTHSLVGPRQSDPSECITWKLIIHFMHWFCHPIRCKKDTAATLFSNRHAIRHHHSTEHHEHATPSSQNHARLLYFGYFWFLDFFLGNRKSNLFVVPLCFRHLRHWRGWSFDDLRLRPGFYLHFRLQCYWKTKQRGDGFSTRHTGLVIKCIKSII